MKILLALAVAAGSPDVAGPLANSAEHARRVEARRVEGATAATGPMISYEVRFVTTNDLDWRGQFDPSLKPVARQGGAAAWSADAATTRALFTHWQENTSTNIMMAPRAVTPSDGEVRVVNELRVNYVAHLERVADGAVNKATALAFRPEVDQVRDGIRAQFSAGRLEDQGLRARVAIDLDRLVHFRTATYSETVYPAVTPGDDSPRQSRPTGLAATIQVPVVDSSRIDGEWVIPKDGALIVSMGIEATGKVFKKSRSEKLLVISYRPEPGQEPAPIDPIKTTSATADRSKAPAGN